MLEALDVPRHEARYIAGDDAKKMLSMAKSMSDSELSAVPSDFRKILPQVVN